MTACAPNPTLPGRGCNGEVGGFGSLPVCPRLRCPCLRAVICRLKPRHPTLSPRISDPGRHSGLIAFSTHIELDPRDDRFSMPELIRSRQALISAVTLTPPRRYPTISPREWIHEKSAWIGHFSGRRADSASREYRGRKRSGSCRVRGMPWRERVKRERCPA